LRHKRTSARALLLRPDGDDLLIRGGLTIDDSDSAGQEADVLVAGVGLCYLRSSP